MQQSFNRSPRDFAPSGWTSGAEDSLIVDATNFSMDAMQLDLEAVVQRSGVERFVLTAWTAFALACSSGRHEFANLVEQIVGDSCLGAEVGDGDPSSLGLLDGCGQERGRFRRLPDGDQAS